MATREDRRYVEIQTLEHHHCFPEGNPWPSATVAIVTGGRLPLDVAEDAASYRVMAQLPLSSGDDVRVEMAGRCIIITTGAALLERWEHGAADAGGLATVVELPTPFEQGDATVQIIDGVLAAILPKRTGRREPPLESVSPTRSLRLPLTATSSR